MRSSALLFALALMLPAATATAYPQYIAKGYAQCEGCHYSPTGGGIITSMGQSSLEALVPDLLSVAAVSKFRGAIAKPEVTGRDEEDKPRLQFDIGLDSRLLFVRSSREVGAEKTWVAVPMLLEGGGIVAFGPVMAYATATVRRRSTAEYAVTGMSREHWLSFELKDSLKLRAGRMVLPFGLRMPDHTLYTREDFGFNKWNQSYAAAIDFVGEKLEVHGAAFAGDLWLEPPAMQARGAAVSVSHALLDDRLSLGASGLFGVSQSTTRPAASVFLRAKLPGATYVLGEAAGQRRQGRASGQAQLQGAGFLRVGWFPHESTDIFGEVSGRTIQGGNELIKLRYQFGVNSHLLPWVELSPAVVLEEDVETGLKPTFLAQVHIFY